MLEAICLKKFIISSNCPTGPREILNNGKGGLLFKSKNYKELAKKISLQNSTLDLKKIVKINFSNPIIYEKNQKIFAKSKVKFDVNDQQEFYRRFLIPRQNRIDLNKVYFEIEYNIDDENYFLSNINFDQKKINDSVFYEIKNIQQLNNVISKEFKKVSLE